MGGTEITDLKGDERDVERHWSSQAVLTKLYGYAS